MAPPEVYISYAWRDREQAPTPDDRESIVDELCVLLTEKNCAVRRDKTQTTYKQSIGDFMRQIGAANQVVAVVSDKYLRSKYCMYEAIEMLNHRDLEARLFPLVLEDAKIYNAKSALVYVAFWEKEVTDMETALAGVKSETAKFRYQEELRDLKEIAEKIQDLMTWIADKNTLSAQTHLESRFQHLLDLLLPPASEAVTVSHRLTNSAEPVFPKLKILDYAFGQALRPAQTKSVVAKLPSSLNLIGERGQGRHRFMEDLETCGLANTVLVLRIKLNAFLANYDAFLREIARQGNIPATSADLVDLLRQCAVQQQQPVLFILENPDELYADRPGMDQRFDIGFLQKLNALKNASFITLLLSSYTSVKELTFRGQSSPLWLEVVALNSLSHEEITQEITRRLPDLPDHLRGFIAEQLEFEPNHTHDLLKTLLDTLDGRGNPSRDFIGQELKALRLKYGRL